MLVVSVQPLRIAGSSSARLVNHACPGQSGQASTSPAACVCLALVQQPSCTGGDCQPEQASLRLPGFLKPDRSMQRPWWWPTHVVTQAGCCGLTRLASSRCRRAGGAGAAEVRPAGLLPAPAPPGAGHPAGFPGAGPPAPQGPAVHGQAPDAPHVPGPGRQPGEPGAAVCGRGCSGCGRAAAVWGGEGAGLRCVACTRAASSCVDCVRSLGGGCNGVLGRHCRPGGTPDGAWSAWSSAVRTCSCPQPCAAQPQACPWRVLGCTVAALSGVCSCSCSTYVCRVAGCYSVASLLRLQPCGSRSFLRTQRPRSQAPSPLMEPQGAKGWPSSPTQAR